MQFLQKYAIDYFLALSESSSELEFQRGNITYAGIVNNSRDRIEQFRKELLFQIDLIESTGEFSGDKFKKLQEKVNEQEQEIIRLTAKIDELEKSLEERDNKIYEQDHPEDKQFIPDSLNQPEFLFAMEYLEKKKIVTTFTHVTQYGRAPLCYVWAKTAKPLFGYLVDRISYELELRKKGRLDWKLFRPAFRNYDEIVKQGKNAVSIYKYWSDPAGPLPENYHLVEEALEYATRRMDEFDISSK